MLKMIIKTDYQNSSAENALLTYEYRERMANGLSSVDSNRLFKMLKSRSLVAKS
jgi:hypothetical protein